MLLFIKPPKVFTLVFEEATSNVLSPTLISISPPEESTKASLKDLKLFPLSDLKDRRGSPKTSLKSEEYIFLYVSKACSKLSI